MYTGEVIDVIVIGAGPAGCMCAAQLAEFGKRVLILEKNDARQSKPCGDGISRRCVKLLQDLGFPWERFEENGAVRIKNIVHIKNGGSEVYPIDRSPQPMYGVSRYITDRIFRDYAQEKGVVILYNIRADKIEKEQDLFRVAGYRSKKVAIACGSVVDMTICNKRVKNRISSMAVGISATIRCQSDTEPSFFFVYDRKYYGTYAWLFKTEEDNWNVGLWLKRDKERLKDLFDEFFVYASTDILHAPAFLCAKPRGAIMPVERTLPDLNDAAPDGVFFAGDVCGTADPESGEGIPQAIRSGRAAAKKMWG